MNLYYYPSGHDEGNHDTFQPIKLMPILFITTYILRIIGVNIQI
jgi:hypothetical protein